MKVFNQYENVIFDIFSDLLSSGKQDISLEDVQEAFSKRMHDIPDINNSTLMNDFPVFYIDEDGYHPIIDTYEGFPIRLTSMEKQAVHDAVSSPASDIFLSISEKYEISDSIGNLNPLYDEKTIRHNVQHFHPSKQAINNIKVLIGAVSGCKAVLLQNLSLFSPVKEPEKAFPVSLEYTVQTGVWTVAAYVPNAKRYINFNVARITVKPTEETFPKSVKEEHRKFVKTQKKRTAIIHIDAPNYAIDRIFRLFSFYERQTVAQKDGSYLMTLQYYDYDKAPLIRNILSAGSYAIVQSPEDLINDVIEEIRCTLSAA